MNLNSDCCAIAEFPRFSQFPALIAIPAKFAFLASQSISCDRAGTLEWRYSTRVHGRPKFLLTLGFFVCVLSNCGGNSCQAFHYPRAKCPAKCKIAEIDNENELAKDDLVSNNGVGLNKISWQQGYILS